MAVIINGDTGIDKITDGSVVQADLAGGGLYPKVPAFRATLSGTFAISAVTQTKMPFKIASGQGGSNFDTHNSFDDVTNYRFQPTVAGYYMITFTSNVSGMTAGNYIANYIKKNGISSEYQTFVHRANNDYLGVTNSGLVYLNGSTDYIEFYVFTASNGTMLASTLTVASGYLVSV